MDIEKVRQQLINENLNPDDYVILPNADGTGYQAWKKEFAPDFARFAIQEDKPQKEDIEVVAETAIYTAMDLQQVAEMLVYALQEIEELKGMVNNNG